MNKNIGFFDYMREAFDFRVAFPGIGGIPINYIYLALALGVSAAFWPAAMFFIAGELAYLFGLSSNLRFQQIIRDRLLQGNKCDANTALHELSSKLQYKNLSNYQKFSGRCHDVIEIAKSILGEDNPLIDTYQENLWHLKEIMAKMLYILEVTESNFDPDINAKIKALKDEIQQKIDNGDLSSETINSEQQRLEILNQRLQYHEQIENRIQLIKSECRRVSEQINLIKDQVILLNNRDPDSLTQNMDATAAAISEHTDWVHEHEMLLLDLN